VGDRSVQELHWALALDQPLVSQQLSMLRGKQIVSARKLGTTVRYGLRDPLIQEMLQMGPNDFRQPPGGNTGHVAAAA